MTRLTNQTYIMNRQALREEWNSAAGGAFVLLLPAEQWSLHEYYRFTEPLSRKQLLAHRTVITASCPSLPQRAGRAYAHLRFFSPRLERYVQEMVARPVPSKTSKKNVFIFSEVRAAVDPQAIAHLLLLFDKEGRRNGS